MFSRAFPVCLLFASAVLAKPLIPELDKRACNADNCARAVTGTSANVKPSLSVRQSDCSSFLAITIVPVVSTTTTVYPSTTTVTEIVSTTTTAVVSATSTSSVVSTETSTVSIVVTATSTVTTTPAANQKRDLITALTVAPSNVPAYASACSGTARYSSACSCLGVSKVTNTASASTSTITITSVATATTTSTVPLTASTTTTQTLTISTTITATTIVSTTTTTLTTATAAPTCSANSLKATFPYNAVTNCGCTYCSTPGRLPSNALCAYSAESNSNFNSCANRCDFFGNCLAFVLSDSGDCNLCIDTAGARAGDGSAGYTTGFRSNCVDPVCAS